MGKSSVLSFSILLFCSSLLGATDFEKVSLQLRWEPQFQFAGYFAARWQGYYEDAGLEVEIRSAVTPEKKILSAVGEVAEGRADFGVGAADILIGINEGSPLVVLAPIFQRSAAAFFAKETTGLRSPADFLRLKVARNVNDLIDVEMQAVLRSEGIDPEKVIPFPHLPGVQHLVDGRVDVMPGTIFAAYDFQFLKIGVTIMHPGSYGIDFYGDSLFTSSGLTVRDPDLVERFREASLRGWRYALEHPLEIADRIALEIPRRVPVTGGNLKAYNEFQIPLVTELTLYPVVEIGHLNPLRWQQMNQQLMNSGVVQREIDPDMITFDPVRNEIADKAGTSRVLELSLYSIGGVLLLALGFIFLLRSQISRATSALRHREEALRQSEENLEITLLSIGDAVITTDVAGVISRMNSVAEELTGWSVAEAKGRLLAEVFKIINSLTREPQANPVQNVLDHGLVVGLANHTALIARNGVEYQISDSAAPIRNQEGEIFGVVLVFKDVTEQYQVVKSLQESEAKNQAILNAIPDLIFMNTREGEYLSFHAPDARALYVAPEIFLHKRITEVLPEAIGRQFLEAFARALDSDTVQELNYPLVIDGTEKFFEARVARYSQDRVISTIRDVTARVQAEKTQQQLQSQLIQSQKMEGLGLLASGVAHDMNNVLAAISATASVQLMILPKDSKTLKAFETIQRAVQRGGSMVSSLLSLTWKDLSEVRTLNWNSLIQEQETLLQHTTLSSVTVVTRLEQNLALIDGDPGSLGHALMNLCINAVDAMKDLSGERILTLTTRNGEQTVEVEVADNGSGMTPEVKERALDAFFTTKPRGKGTGLGLSLVNNIVQLHHGRLLIESGLGLGTTIRMIFPVSTRTESLVIPSGKEAGGGGQNQKKVLLVDDDDLVRESFGGLLTTLDCSVIEVSRGESALEVLARDSDFDLVLLDMNMPGMGGHQTLAGIRRLYPVLPVLVTTGLADQKVMDLVSQTPHTTILAKPFDLQDLKRKIFEE